MNHLPADLIHTLTMFSAEASAAEAPALAAMKALRLADRSTVTLPHTRAFEAMAL